MTTNKKQTCPIFSSEMYGDCIKEECGWFVDEADKCAIKVIGLHLHRKL